MAIDIEKRLAETEQAIAALQAMTGSVPDEAIEIHEIMQRCIAAEAKLERLQNAVWPGLPLFVSTPEKQKEDFFIIVAEGLHEARIENYQLHSLRDEYDKLRKILAHIPARIAIEAKEKAGFGVEIKPQVAVDTYEAKGDE